MLGGAREANHAAGGEIEKSRPDKLIARKADRHLAHRPILGSDGPLGRAIPYVRLLLESQCAWMAGAGPRSKKQQKTRVCESAYFVALSGCKLHQAPGLSIDRLAAVIRDPYRAVHEDDPGSLVDLVVLEHLALGEVEHDHARLLG
jgi:hypothetical protein